jgi:hypothetical protein
MFDPGAPRNHRTARGQAKLLRFTAKWNLTGCCCIGRSAGLKIAPL